MKPNTALETTTDDEYKKMVDYMKKNNISPNEAVNVAKAVQQGNPFTSYNYTIGDNRSKLLIGGDLHTGSLEHKKALVKYAAEVANKEKVDAVILGGDLFDGWYQNRPASIFEQNAIGLDQQLKLVKQELKAFKQPIYFITANHEYNTFMRGAGIEVGHYLESELNLQGNEAHFLGNGEARLIIGKNTRYDIIHPDGGTAYALSYRPQKIIESLEGGKKPHLMSIHHFHKAEYLFYRNVHCIQAGTFCGQTKFMKGKNISAHLGFWIVDMSTSDSGTIDKITPTFYPAYK